jgi:hypothetical protein
MSARSRFVVVLCCIASGCSSDRLTGPTAREAFATAVQTRSGSPVEFDLFVDGKLMSESDVRANVPADSVEWIEVLKAESESSPRPKGDRSAVRICTKAGARAKAC